MRRVFGAIRPVAVSTAIEGLQQPVVLLLSLACFVLVALQPVVQLHTFGDSARLARDCGMGFLLVFGVLSAAFTAGLLTEPSLSLMFLTTTGSFMIEEELNLPERVPKKPTPICLFRLSSVCPSSVSTAGLTSI